MSKPAPRELEVIRSVQLTPHMQRITLGGSGMSQFPDNQESAYIKLFFPRDDGEKPMVRTYTVRQQRAGEIDVDFNLHGTSGPASRWAVETQPGDRILVGGPGPKKMINPDADWHLLAGDMTALPAISVNLEQLPENACGHAVISILHEDDIQALKHPEQIKLHWVVIPEPDPEGQLLLEYIANLELPEGQPSIWTACEFTSMRALRKHFKDSWQPARENLYISSYWKLGRSEDQHKVIKRQDAEAADQ
ncbi:siderophore-interacting protein [Marinobacterium sp. YM272]|uniref:siderophore-interacting protein n=1 Tax=Marinobacterium sp. YM272 TaxID=3421654 RepID=UPI003D7F4901